MRHQTRCSELFSFAALTITTFALMAALTACSGVNVGNALTVAIGAEDTDVPTITQTSALFGRKLLNSFDNSDSPHLDSITSLTLSKLLIHVKKIAFLPEAECNTPDSTVPADWYRTQVSLDIDLLNPPAAIDATSSGDVLVPAIFKPCKARLTIAPASTGLYSIEMSGTTAIGNSFSVHSSEHHPLTLKSSSGVNFSDADGKGLEVVLHKQRVLKNLDLDSLAAPREITPDTNAEMFSAVMATVRHGLRGYRLKKVNDVLQGDRSLPLSEGDATSTEALTGEEN